jgi:hypothetical protein
MDARLALLNRIKHEGWAKGNLLGLLNVLIGRRIEDGDATPVSNGITWRELASLLKKARWDKSAVEELPIQSVVLPPRDREKFWYAVIAHAQVGSADAVKAGDRLAERMRKGGLVVGDSP